MSTTTQNIPWYRHLNRAQWRAFSAAWLGYLLDGFDFVLIALVLTEVQGGKRRCRRQVRCPQPLLYALVRGLMLGAMGDRYGRRGNGHQHRSLLGRDAGLRLCARLHHHVYRSSGHRHGDGGCEYGSSATYVIESWPKHLRNKASGFLISGFSVGAVVAACRSIAWWFRSGVGVRCSLSAFCQSSLLSGCVKTSGSEDWKEKHAGKAPVRTMVDILYRGEHRIANIVMTLAAATALWFCSPVTCKMLQSSLFSGCYAPQSLSALWCKVRVNAGQRA
ncbi:hypothetical protein ACLK10_17995 [Escherichia coli]